MFFKTFVIGILIWLGFAVQRVEEKLDLLAQQETTVASHGPAKELEGLFDVGH